MTDKTVKVKVEASGLKETTAQAKELNKELDKASASRKVKSADQARKIAEGDDTGLRRGTAGGGNRGGSRDFARQAQGLGGLVHLYATFAANIFAVTAAFQALSKAMDVERMQKATEILSMAGGQNLKGIAAGLREVADGAMSAAEALQFTNFGTTAGLNKKQLEDLTKVAKGASLALGRDMSDSLSRVMRGTVKLEPELLDELGIITKAGDAYKDYARQLGVTEESLSKFQKMQAFTNAVIAEGESKYGALQAVEASPFTMFTASLSDAANEILKFINNGIAPLLKLLSDSPTAMKGILIGLAAYLANVAIPRLRDWGSVFVENARKSRDASAELFKDFVRQQDEIVTKQKATIQAGYQDAFQANAGAINALNTSLNTALGAKGGKAIKETIGGLVADSIIAPEVQKKLGNNISSALRAQERIVAGLLPGKHGAATEEQKTAASAKVADLTRIRAGLDGQIATHNANVLKMQGAMAEADKVRVSMSDRLVQNWLKIQMSIQGIKTGGLEVLGALGGANIDTSKGAKQEKGKNPKLAVENVIAVATVATALREAENQKDKLKDASAGLDKQLEKSRPLIDKTKTSLIGFASSLGNLASKFLGMAYWIGLGIVALDLMLPASSKAIQKIDEFKDSIKETSDVLKGSIISISNAQDTLVANPAIRLIQYYNVLGNSLITYSDKLREAEQNLIELSNAEETWLDKLLNTKKRGIESTTSELLKLLEVSKDLKGSGLSEENLNRIRQAGSLEERLGILRAISAESKRQGEINKDIASRAEDVKSSWTNALASVNEYNKKQSEIHVKFQPFVDNIKKFVDYYNKLPTNKDKALAIITLPKETRELIVKWLPDLESQLLSVQGIMDKEGSLFSTIKNDQELLSNFFTKGGTAASNFKAELEGINDASKQALSRFNLDSGVTIVNSEDSATNIANLTTAGKNALEHQYKNYHKFLMDSEELRKKVDGNVSDEQKRMLEAQIKLIQENARQALANIAEFKRRLYEQAGIRGGADLDVTGIDSADAAANEAGRKAAEKALRVQGISPIETAKTSGNNTLRNPNTDNIPRNKTDRKKYDNYVLEGQIRLQKVEVEAAENRLKYTELHLGLLESANVKYGKQYQITTQLQNNQKLEVINKKESLNLIQAVEKLQKEEFEANSLSGKEKAKKLAIVRAAYQEEATAIINSANIERKSLEVSKLKTDLLSQQVAKAKVLSDLAATELRNREAGLAAIDDDPKFAIDKIKQIEAVRFAAIKDTESRKHDIITSFVKEIDTLEGDNQEAIQDKIRKFHLELQGLDVEAASKQLSLIKDRYNFIKVKREEDFKKQEANIVALFSSDYMKNAQNALYDTIEERIKAIGSQTQQLIDGSLNSMDATIDRFAKMMQEGTINLRELVRTFRNSLSDVFKDMAASSLKKAGYQLLQGLGIKSESAEDIGNSQLAVLELIAINTGSTTTEVAAAKTKTANSIGDLGSLFDSGIKWLGETIFGKLLKELITTITTTSAASAATEAGGNIFTRIIGAVLPGFGGSGGTATNFNSIGFDNVPSNVMLANGGIVSQYGPLKLNRYAEGGVATSPQLAVFGEGRMNEAYVPLPDGRSIPVTMSGASSNNINVVVNIDNNGNANSNITADTSAVFGKQLAVVIDNAVKREMINQQRSGGILPRR